MADHTKADHTKQTDAGGTGEITPAEREQNQRIVARAVLAGEVRCELCLGMGYRGRQRGVAWRIVACEPCRGTGQRLASDRQRGRQTAARTRARWDGRGR